MSLKKSAALFALLMLLCLPPELLCANGNLLFYAHFDGWGFIRMPRR